MNGIVEKLQKEGSDIAIGSGLIVEPKHWVSVSKANEKGIPFYEARNFHFVKEQTSYGNTERIRV
ncbi:hypothetical protein [Bacillus coreaensis]